MKIKKSSLLYLFLTNQIKQANKSSHTNTSSTIILSLRNIGNHFLVKQIREKLRKTI